MANSTFSHHGVKEMQEPYSKIVICEILTNLELCDKTVTDELDDVDAADGKGSY
jgi:hypothetical protein